MVDKEDIDQLASDLKNSELFDKISLYMVDGSHYDIIVKTVENVRVIKKNGTFILNVITGFVESELNIMDISSITRIKKSNRREFIISEKLVEIEKFKTIKIFLTSKKVLKVKTDEVISVEENGELITIKMKTKELNFYIEHLEYFISLNR